MDKAKRVFQGIYKMMWEKQPLKRADLAQGKTAMIIMDMVNGFIREGALKNEDAADLIQPITDLMGYFKDKGMPMVAFADCHDEDSPEFEKYHRHCLRGTSETEIVDEIKAAGGYTLIEKNSTNGFLEETFQQWLKNNPQITDFVITGVCTDICVMQFCLTLKAWFNKQNIKSRIVLPLNMIDTFDFKVHNVTLTNAMAMYFMEQNGAEVCLNLDL